MKIFTTSQVRSLDQYTIEHEPVASIHLMERAADALAEAYTETFALGRPVLILAGPGNNGGDALALARKMMKFRIDVKVILLCNSRLSPDCAENKLRLLQQYPAIITELTDGFVAPELTSDTIIIDGLFGSGLTRPLTGIFADAVGWMNACSNEVLAVDIPSGLQGERNPDLTVPIVRANHTFTLQFPKLAFMLPDTAPYVGDWTVLNIGIHPDAVLSTDSPFSMLTKSDVQPLFRKREKFSHKGTYGHVLILAGSRDMAGAAILAARAALRSGAGLVTVHSAACNRIILQTAVPEAIFHSDQDEAQISLHDGAMAYAAVAVGPGIGTSETTMLFLERLLHEANKPCLLDADALNIISQRKHLLELIPQMSILTPHPGEFERLFGSSASSYDRMILASDMARKYQIIIVLKGAHSLIALPDGQMIFNSTGNAGMATAGMGDVLTGIIAGLLAQGYVPAHAAVAGVYLHGLAGDKALNQQSKESLLAGDIVDYLGDAYKILQK